MAKRTGTTAVKPRVRAAAVPVEQEEISVKLNAETAVLLNSAVRAVVEAVAKRDLMIHTIVTSQGYDPAKFGIKQTAEGDYRIEPFPKEMTEG